MLAPSHAQGIKYSYQFKRTICYLLAQYETFQMLEKYMNIENTDTAHK